MSENFVCKCLFCGRLYESNPGENQACPRCVQAAKNNEYPSNPSPIKKFIEGDALFDQKEFLSEHKGEFFESSEYHPKA